jgi:hypothetical protein
MELNGALSNPQPRVELPAWLLYNRVCAAWR